VSTKGRIVIAGSVAQRPGCGGHTWVFLQYLLGFKRLGWDVLLLDRLEPDMCVDAHGSPHAMTGSYNLDYFSNVMTRFGLDGAYSVTCNGGEHVLGLPYREAAEFVASAELVLNVMGFFNGQEVLRRARRRVFLDIDPGFGQMWRETSLHDLFAGNDDFVTIGLNVGRADCAIPTCGLRWITTAQPVVLDAWPCTGADATGAAAPITSVATWRGPFGPVEYKGQVYGRRAHEFRRFAALPQHASGTFELALDIHPADAKDLALLRDNGWQLVEPTRVAADPWSYQRYIRNSAAELMIAKGMYVQTRSGWLSDRSLCYLASGRPVIAQDTGIANHIPVRKGLLTFRTFDEAVDAVREVRGDYTRHARAARALAERFFDSDRILGDLLSRLGVAA